MSKRRRHFSFIWILAVIVGLLAVLVIPKLAFADGGSGGGGDGGGPCGGGPCTSNGFGWARYPIDSGGPTGYNGYKFRKDFPPSTTDTWHDAVQVCSNAEASSINVFIIADSSGNGTGYNYDASYGTSSNPNFAAGKHPDKGNQQAVAIKTGSSSDAASGSPNASAWAQWKEFKLIFPGNATGTFGSNVAWFCANYPASAPVSCSATADTPTVTAAGAASTITITGKGNVSWVDDGGNGYYIKRIGATDNPNENNYANIQHPGGKTYQNVVHPQPLSGTSVTYTYSVYNSSGNTISGATCTAKVTVSPTTFTCTATPVATDSTNETVRVSVTNQGPNPGGKGFQVRQTPNSQSWPTDASGGFSQNFTVGGTASFNFTRPANAAESYTLYDGTGNSASIVGKSPLCSTPAGTVSATCSPGATPATPSPGVAFSSTYTITVSNTTGAAAPAYRLVAAADGGGVTGTTVTKLISIPTGSSTQPITITITANYAGSYTVTLYNASNAVVPQTPCTQNVIPQVAPYFQAWQNDAAGGGGFEDTTNSCGNVAPVSYPAYVSPQAATNARATTPAQYFGGIRGFSGTTYKSKSDFGAVALGLIPNPSGEGFYSLNNASTAGKYLSFANTGVPAGGTTGYLNSVSANHCAQDYYDNTKEKTNIHTIPDLSTLQSEFTPANCTDSNGNHRCQFQVTSGNPTISGLNIPSGFQVTVYVAGNVTISGNITYSTSGAPDSFDPTNRASIPYFGLIVKGNIEVRAAVTQMDGLYVAQPVSFSGLNTTGGDFSTCDTSQGAQCTSQLIVNGAVVAQHVEPLRSHGSSLTLGGSAVNTIGNNPAEIFNFVPSMVLGAPDFNTQAISAQGLYSLPPVF